MPETTDFMLYGRTFNWHVAPEFGEHGDVVSVLSISTEVTAQRVLERELRESGDFIAQVIASAQEEIVVVDRELRYVIRNRVMEQLTGIPSSDLLGVSLVERTVPQLDELIRYIEAALAGDVVRSRDAATAAVERPDRPLPTVPRPDEPVPVLLVEDEEAVARTVRRMLEVAGYSVTLASDGHEARAVLRARPGAVRAVVLDLAMPGLGGADTYRELRLLDPLLPVLVTSGYADGDDMLAIGDDLRAAFLAKPYVPAELAAALGRLLGAAARAPAP